MWCCHWVLKKTGWLFSVTNIEKVPQSSIFHEWPFEGTFEKGNEPLVDPINESVHGGSTLELRHISRVLENKFWSLERIPTPLLLNVTDQCFLCFLITVRNDSADGVSVHDIFYKTYYDIISDEQQRLRQSLQKKKEKKKKKKKRKKKRECGKVEHRFMRFLVSEVKRGPNNDKIFTHAH